MKLNFRPLALLLAVAGAALNAAPLTQTTAVFAKPDASTAAFTVLKAGSEPVLAPGVTAPPGWVAVTIAGPLKAYAANKDISKALQVHAGAPYRTEPKADAPIIALATDADHAEISGLHGRWTEFKLTTAITGYIQSSAVPSAAAPALAASPAATTPSAPATTDAPAPAIVIPGKPAPMGDGGSSALPRLFQGKLVSTYSAFRPRRPYDYQLNDSGGERYAYLDVSKLLATEQFNSYIDRTVVVYGTAKPVPGTKDIVILVESLQLH